jgi:hypothetical protein
VGCLELCHELRPTTSHSLTSPRRMKPTNGLPQIGATPAHALLHQRASAAKLMPEDIVSSGDAIAGMRRRRSPRPPGGQRSHLAALSRLAGASRSYLAPVHIVDISC